MVPRNGGRHMKVATFVKDLDGFRGSASLYRLDPPMKSVSCEDDTEPLREYVVVSAVHAFDGNAETYIFSADETGDVDCWLELDGSFRGALDQERALNEAGYTVKR